MLVLSGTEVVEGGPVSVVHSQQTLFSQFCNKGLYCRNLVNLVGFPAPLQHKAPHSRRDFPDEPLLSIVTDMRQKATLTAAQNHCYRASVPVTKTLVQRSRTYDTFTEAYHSSERQEEVRRVQTWNLTARLEFTMNSKHPRLSQNLYPV